MGTLERAEIGVDGNCGFALLGDDLQSGEAVFVEINPVLWRIRHKRFIVPIPTFSREVG